MDTFLLIILIMFALYVLAANANDKRRRKGHFTTSEFLMMHFEAQDRARKHQREKENENK
jgi:hypothetical protein